MDQVNQAIQAALDARERSNQNNPSPIANHMHNGTDSPQVSLNNLADLNPGASGNLLTSTGPKSNPTFQTPTVKDQITATAGEDLLANDAVFISNFTGDNTILDTACTGGEGTWGQNTGVQKVAQSFSFPLSTQLISKITVSLKKVGTPTDNIVITLRNALDGNILQTIATLDGSTLSTSYADFSYTLSEFICAKNTSYYVQMTRSGALDDTNYYRWNGGSQGYANGAAWGYQTGAWATGYAPVSDFKLIFKMTTASGSVYKCRADIVGFYEVFNGFVVTGVSKGATVTIDVAPQHTMSGLSGHIQYLTDSPGLIGTTPGTYKKPIGFANSATSLNYVGLGIRNYNSGVNTLNSSTTLNIAHGLSVRPRFIRITSATAATSIYSVGTYAGNHYGNGNGVVSTLVSYNTGVITMTTDANNIIYINPSAGNSLLAVLSGTDETNFSLVSTLSGSCTATFVWEVFS